MKNKIETLRVKAIKNNIIWLKSFGCKVQIENAFMSIDQEEVSKYKAYLILEPSQEAIKKLKEVLDEIRDSSIKPGIYLDASVKNHSLKSALIAMGYQHYDINVTMAGFVSQKFEKSIFKLLPASLDDLGLWSSIYSEAFGRSGNNANIDYIRWARAFKTNDRVRHWFMLKQNKYIGVCQTCTGYGIIGINSFCIKPLNRSVSNLRGTLKALRTKLTEKGDVMIYFDLLKKENNNIRRRMANPPKGFSVIREMIGYHIGA